MTESERERFLNKVSIPADVLSGCWLWTGAKNNDGYGQAWATARNGKRRVNLAHRIFYEYINGVFDTKLCVRHRCDNPACVNPTHLELGTHQQNMRDMVERHRVQRVGGERHYNAKLTQEDVEYIAYAHARGIQQKELCKVHAVGKTCVSNIVQGKRWNPSDTSRHKKYD